MRHNINFLVSELGPTQQNYYLIRNVNRLHEDKTNYNVQVFTENLSRFCMKPIFGVMSVAEAWGQNGPFIAVNQSTAAKMLNYPLASRKLFYVWDLEFIRPWNLAYDYYSSIYTDKDIELIARSKDHADLIRNAFNKDCIAIVDNFNIDQIIEILK